MPVTFIQSGILGTPSLGAGTHQLSPVNTNSGRIRSSSTTYNDARSGGGTATLDLTSSGQVGQRLNAGTYEAYQTFLEFNTKITPGFALLSAVLKLYVSADNTTDDFTIEATVQNYGTLATADFTAGASLPSTRGATSSTLSIGTGLKTLTMNGSLIRDGADQNGVVQIRVSSSRQRSGTTPTSNEYLDLTIASCVLELVVVTPADYTGGTVTTPGDGWKYHKFTSDGTITPVTSGSVEYLVVAGGGGGGGNLAGGGGGGGGVLTNTTASISSATAITVGSGGTQASTTGAAGSGNNSSISGIATAIGGGRGATYTAHAAATGGSGGGGGGGASVNNVDIGASGTVGQGNAGGNGREGSSPQWGGGGGGSVGGGANGSASAGGNGGAGTEWPGGSGNYYGGGGGGGFSTSTGAAGQGGSGVGGNGYVFTISNSTSGTANTGGGGGGGCALGGGPPATLSGNGGSGVVIIRYPLPA